MVDIVLTKKFKKRLIDTGLALPAVARLFRTTPTYFKRIWEGEISPDATFFALAIQAGLGENLSDIAEVRAEERKTA